MLLTPGTLLISVLPYYARLAMFLSLGALSLLLLYVLPNLPFGPVLTSIGITLLTYLSMSHVALTKARIHQVLSLQSDTQDNALQLSSSDPEYNDVANQINSLKRTVGIKNELLMSCATEAKFTATELLKSSDQVAEGAQRESAALDELASTSEEMSTTIGDIADRLSLTTKMAEQTLNRSEVGSNALNELAQRIDQVNDTVQLNQTQMQALSQASSDILEFVGRIGDITEQINLLSLNAAIESARAGEAGRGFAVVANEVRTLASNTESVTKEISVLVSSMDKQVNQSNQNSGVMTQQTKLAQDALQNAQEMLQEIHTAAKQTQSETQLSSSTIQDFRTANDTLCQRLQEIANVSEKQNQNSQNTKEMVRYLEWLSTRLAPQEA